MLPRSKNFLDEPQDKYYSSVIYVANHLTLSQFLKCLSYRRQSDWLIFQYIIDLDMLQCIIDLDMLTHTWEEPCQCNECDNAFLKNFHLTGHFKIHTGEKPYQCSQCTKAFSMNCDLKWHLKMHSWDKLYKCRHCGKVFFIKN